MEAYLDNSATTCVYQETADLVCDLMVNHYGNPREVSKEEFIELYRKAM